MESAVKKLRDLLKDRNVKVSLKEIKLTEKEIAESNSILFNNIPLEDILPKTETKESDCGSCSDLIGKNTSCRAVSCGSKTYETVPEELIIQAGLKSLII